jgi:hypothetical protein
MLQKNKVKHLAKFNFFPSAETNHIITKHVLKFYHVDTQVPHITWDFLINAQLEQVNQLSV